MNRSMSISMALFLLASFYNCVGMEFKKRNSLVPVVSEYPISKSPIKIDVMPHGQRVNGDQQVGGQWLLKYARKGIATCVFATGAHWTAKHVDEGNLIQVLVGFKVTLEAYSYLFSIQK